MNKTAIKNFAVWARNKLITDITYKAGLIGVSKKGIAQPLSQSSKDLQFFDNGTKDCVQVAGMIDIKILALVPYDGVLPETVCGEMSAGLVAYAKKEKMVAYI